MGAAGISHLQALSPAAVLGNLASLVAGDMPAKPPCTNILVKDYFSLSLSNLFFGGVSFLLPPFIACGIPSTEAQPCS